MKKDKNKPQDHRQILMEWETPEFIPTPRGKLWYIVAGLIMTSFVAYGIISDNLTMSIVFVMLAAVFMLVENRKPRMFKAVITDMGIECRGVFYPYHHINAFWVVYHPPVVQVLYLRIVEHRHYKHIRIELNGESPQAVRDLLLKEVPELEGAPEPLSDGFVRLFKLH